MLEWLSACLEGPALEWFNDQPEFTSLHEFGIALTNAFPPKQDNSSSLSILTPKSTCETFESSAESALTASPASPTPPAFFGLFDPELTQDDPESELFCEATGILRQLRQLQHQHRESDLLDLLHDCLWGPALDWFENQPKFISLHDFDIALTKAFPPKESAMNQTPPLNSSDSPTSQEEQELNISPEDLKAIKKPTPTLQDIGIFDPTLTCEDRQFSESAKFLHHLQQCQRLYRESDLLMLLPTCLWGPAFDIWFDRQTTMESTSLSEWIDTLRVDFANAPFAKVKTPKMICMRCNSSFNSKDKLREHVREQHAKKPVESSFLPVDTPKPIYETMEKSAVTDLLAPSVPQEPDTSTATPKQKSESPKAFEAVTSSESSHLQSDAPENVPESVENTSTQCSPISSGPPPPQTFESERQGFCVQEPPEFCSSLTSRTPNLVCETLEKSAIASPPPAPLTTSPEQISENQAQKPSIVSSPLLNDAAKSVCETQKSSALEHYLESPSCSEALRHRLEQQLARRAHQREQEAQKQAEVEKAISQLAHDSNLSINAINLVCEIEETSFAAHKSESTKRSSTCRRCNQTFNSNNKLHEHIRQHHARKPVKSPDLRAPTLKSACKIAEKPAVACSPAPLTPHKPSTPPATPRNSNVWFSTTSEPVTAPTGSDLPIAPYKISPKPMESAVANCPLTPPPTPPHSPVRKHQESHIEKPYLAANDLSRMFAGKSRPFGLRQHHNRRPSQQGSGIRQSRSVKPHLTIENLFEMFDGKSRRKDLFQGQNNVSSQAASGQLQITAYFKPTANQKASISQDSKSSKPKSLNQHMPAESIRIAFSRSLPEKSADLPYKWPDVSCRLKSSNPNKTLETVSFISILLRLLPVFLLALAIVSAVSAAKTGCINAYRQAISAIDRAIQ